MELGREPILSKKGDEDIGTGPCATNIPRGCDHLVHCRRKKDRPQAQKKAQKPMWTRRSHGRPDPQGDAQPQSTLWTPASACKPLSQGQTHTKPCCEATISHLMLHIHSTGKEPAGKGTSPGHTTHNVNTRAQPKASQRLSVIFPAQHMGAILAKTFFRARPWLSPFSLPSTQGCLAGLTSCDLLGVAMAISG